MITAEDSLNLQRVYHYFLQNEKDESANSPDYVTSWNKVDDYMTYLEFLDTDQLMREVGVQLEIHANGNPRCNNNHPPEQPCVVNDILDAVVLLNREYVNGEPIYSEDEYVLKKYLAISQAGVIVF